VYEYGSCVNKGESCPNEKGVLIFEVVFWTMVQMWGC